MRPAQVVAGNDPEASMDSRKVAVIVGVGPGLGCALAQRFARAEMNVAMASRHPERLDALAAECSGIGRGARTYRCDATEEDSVLAFFRQVREEQASPRGRTAW